MMSNIDSIDPLKIELENVKLEAEADLEDDPLKLNQELSTSIKTEQLSNTDDHEFAKQRTRNRKKNLKCDKCPTKFKYLCALTAHKQKIHEKNKLDFHKCDFCDLRLKNLQDIFVHIRYVHEGKSVVQCTICNKCFDSKAKLEEHIEIIHKGKIPKCEICVKEFSCKSSLENHEKAYHKGNFLFKCEFLGWFGLYSDVSKV